MIGQTISHYRILVKLGAGGMGVIYTRALFASIEFWICYNNCGCDS